MKILDPSFPPLSFPNNYRNKSFFFKAMRISVICPAARICINSHWLCREGKNAEFTILEKFWEKEKILFKR